MNPRIRAKASMFISRSVPRLVNSVEYIQLAFVLFYFFIFIQYEAHFLLKAANLQDIDGIEAFGVEKLIQIGASQLNDKLPESRDAARTLLLELQSVYKKSHAIEPIASSEEPAVDFWEHFCQSNLSPLSAQAVLRVTNTARQGLVSGS